MIESYFETLTNMDTNENIKITPLVKSLTGVIKLPDDFNYKRSRSKYLKEKHQ